jgi:hypothetical protein
LTYQGSSNTISECEAADDEICEFMALILLCIGKNLQFSAGMKHTGLYGIFRAIEDFGDILIRQTMVKS